MHGAVSKLSSFHEQLALVVRVLYEFMLHAFASNACATFGCRETIVQQGRVGQVVGLAYGVFCV